VSNGWRYRVRISRKSCTEFKGLRPSSVQHVHNSFLGYSSVRISAARTIENQASAVVYSLGYRSVVLVMSCYTSQGEKFVQALSLDEIGLVAGAACDNPTAAVGQIEWIRPENNGWWYIVCLSHWYGDSWSDPMWSAGSGGS